MFRAISFGGFLVSLAIFSLKNYCYAQDSAPVFPVSTFSSIKFGALLPLSGTEARIGEDCRHGIEIAQNNLNNQSNGMAPRIEVIYGDSRTEAKTGISEYRRLIDIGGASAIISFASQISMPLNPISLREKTPLLGIVGHNDFVKNNPYAFRFWPSAEREGEALAKKAIELNKLKAAIITLEDEWMLSLTGSFSKKYLELGGQVSFTETIAGRELDFRALVSKISRLGVELIMLNVGTFHMGPLIKQIREQGLKQQLVSNYLVRQPDVIRVAGTSNVEGILFPELNTNRPRFLAAYAIQAKGNISSAATYSCYTALAMLLQATTLLQNPESVKNKISKEALYEKLLSIKKVELLDEEVVMKNREAIFDLGVRTIIDGKVEDL